MKVRRIVANLAGKNLEAAAKFYRDVFGLAVEMDLGFIITLGSDEEMSVQVSVASEGGSGTPVPDISVEVDDLDEVLRRLQKAKLEPEYGPVTEPWGVRRVYVRDPLGKLVNVLEHGAA